MSSGDTTESIEAKPKSALYTRAPTRPRRPRSEARPAEGRKRANVPRRAPPTGRARRLPEAHTMAGRGSAESSRAARPRWVMMEISRVARASTQNSWNPKKTTKSTVAKKTTSTKRQSTQNTRRGRTKGEKRETNCTEGARRTTLSHRSKRCYTCRQKMLCLKVKRGYACLQNMIEVPSTRPRCE